MRFETRAGIVPPRIEEDRTILIDVEYFRVERIAVGENHDAPVHARRVQVALTVVLRLGQPLAGHDGKNRGPGSVVLTLA